MHPHPLEIGIERLADLRLKESLEIELAQSDLRGCRSKIDLFADVFFYIGEGSEYASVH
jgi:hypothetical protein